MSKCKIKSVILHLFLALAYLSGEGKKRKTMPDIVRATELPPILAGQATPLVERKVEAFFTSVAEIFEAWVHRRESPHTQRAYRADVMAFIDHLEIKWPEKAIRLFNVTVADVVAWRAYLTEEKEAAPKTVNRRIASLSSFYRYLGAAAAELRLPISVPNPAHAQFIARSAGDPLNETRALSATRARQLMGLPSGNSLLHARDRALLKFFLYTGARIGAACRAKAQDFHNEAEHATMKLREKGSRVRTVGIHFALAESLSEYMQMAGIDRGPLFRPRVQGPHSEELQAQAMHPATMYRAVAGYLSMLPGAMQAGSCIYTPHSLRATTATLLLDSGVDIRKVQELLGHKNVTTTQIYDKRRRSVKESASHDVPI